MKQLKSVDLKWNGKNQQPTSCLNEYQKKKKKIDVNEESSQAAGD